MTPFGRDERLSRMSLMLSCGQLERLRNSYVMLFGLGGVGSYAAETLARAGIGRLTVVDNDVVTESNMNRQLPALSSTVGRFKTDVVLERLTDAAPDAEIDAIRAFYLPQSPVLIPEGCDYVADAIDTVSAKLHIAETCARRGIPLISCMGMGNRLDPTKIRIGDIYDTSDCPLCRVMRRELRRRGIQSLRCVYSTEQAQRPKGEGEPRDPSRRTPPGSVPFVPSVAGLYMAYEIVTSLIGTE